MSNCISALQSRNVYTLLVPIFKKRNIFYNTLGPERRENRVATVFGFIIKLMAMLKS